MQEWETIERVGRGVASLAERLLDGDLDARPIVVLAGQGENGAAALVSARCLWQAGAWVQTLCVPPNQSEADWLTTQLDLLQTLGVPLAWAEEGWELPACDLLIEAIVPPGQAGNSRGRERDLILLANSSIAPILSIDSPSGTQRETGRCFSPHIRAAATLLRFSPQFTLPQQPARDAYGTLYFLDEKGTVQLTTL